LCHSDAHTRQGRHICCIVRRELLITKRITEKWVTKNATDYHKAHCMGFIHSTSYAAQEDKFCSTPLQGTKPKLSCSIWNHDKVEQSRTE
jgi:hypothetical protein